MQQIFKFKNQIDAAKKLLEILPKKELLERKTLVICPCIDSVIMVDEICRSLNLNYEMIFCEIITAPNNKECDIAIVSETEDVLLNNELIDSFNISYDYVYGEANRKYEEKILKNIYKFRKGDLLGDLKNKNILLIDEGCETGLTAMCCVKTLINAGAKTISYATPLIATDVAIALHNLVDEIFTVDKIIDFIDVDAYYEDKLDSSDDAIISILEDSPKYLPLQKQKQQEGEE